MLRLRTSAKRSRVALTQAFMLAVAGVITLPTAATVDAASTITNTFGYTGSTQTFTVPDGVTSIEVTLQGAQGGRGGGDSQGSPTPGGYQGVVTGTIAVTPGQEITVAVGGGGGTGASSVNNTGGGSPGLNPLEGYDGSRGGNAGNAGSSGAGGGSGAATVLIVDGTPIVAGGAGGNGGNGQFAPIVGRRAEPTHTARPDLVSTTGRPGWNTADACTVASCDGGASGAGGGGAVGGDRGTIQYGGASATEYFGFGGFPGANATAGLPGLSANYSYYAGNSAHGSLTITYSDGAPSAPLNLAGTSATNAVQLAWDTPSAPGSSPITDYRVEYGTSAGGPFTIFDDGVSTSTSTEVTGLTNGVSYFLRVTAINSVGSGSSATTVVGIVPSDVPDQPTIDDATAFGGGAYIDFTPGDSDIDINSYEYRLDGGAWQTGSVDEDRMTITGLTNGTTYSVEIRAINDIGPSLPSSPAVTVTPIDVPQEPTGTLLSAGDGTIDASWIAPAGNNGSAVTDYVIQWATSIDGAYTTVVDGVSLDTTHQITGLTNGTTYFVRIGAVNAAGTGPWSAPVSATPYTTPSAPAIDITPGDGSLTVGITPGFDGGSAVTAWQYQLDGGAWISTGSLAEAFTVFGLTNATSYDISVRAVNAAGIGDAADTASATPRTVPSPPSISAVALNTGAVSVTFSVGATGGSPITNVEYSIDGGETWITRDPASTSSPLTVSGLTGGVTYPIQLRVVNDAGASGPSNTSSVTAKGTPVAPAIIVTPADSALVVTFAAPANGGSPITNYEYSIDDGSNWVTHAPAATSPLTIAGLTNGTSYDVRLRAVNVVGFSPPSATATATPRTVPSAPVIDGDTVAGGTGSLTATFIAPKFDGGSAILTYQYSTDAGETWRNRDDGDTVESPLVITTESSDGVTPLTGGATYPVELRAVNAAGPGSASAVATGIPTTAPDAPVVIAAEGGNGQANVRFAPPANGGSAILRYEYRLDGGPWVDTDTLASEFVVTGLTNATSYSLELRAVNGVGESDPSAPAVIDVFTTPGAPTLDEITSGDQTLDVAFVAGDDGGSPITGYEYSTDGGQTWRERASGSTASPLAIDSQSSDDAPLVNGTIYDVQIRAVNAAGPGGASESRLAAPRGNPSMPTGLTVTGADSALVISFVAGNDGGSPITAVEYRLDGGDWVDAGSLNSPFNIPGLDNGTTYDVEIRTRNAVGASPETPVVSGTARTVPGAPTAAAATGASGQASVTWSAPADNGGAAISGYTVRLFEQATGGSPIGTCTTTGDLSCVVTGLTNGVTVYADVVAENEAGAGAASAPRAVAIPLGVPSVQIGSITSAATSLSVVVDLVDDGGRPVSNYEYQLDGGAWVSAASGSSPFPVPGLSTGVEYSVRIRATGPGGTSDPSDIVLATPYGLPGAPTALIANSGPGSAALSWTAPASNGGEAITDYVVQFATSAGGPFTTFADGTSAATSATVTGLTNATNYFFRVAAKNPAGTGTNSPLASTTPLAAPSAPTITGITPGTGFLQVAFTAPGSNGGSAVTGYQYRLDGGAWKNTAGTSSPTTITGLTNGTEYDVELRAVNVVGGGTPSATVSATPYGLPGAILGFRATPGAGNVLLEWDPAAANGSPITSYNVIRWSALNEGSIIASYQPTGTSLTLSGLGNGTYYFTVEATNGAGTGPRSTPRTTAIVGSTLPSAPTALGVVVDGSDADLSWTAGSTGSHSTSSYLVQFSGDGSSWTTLASGSSANSASFELPSAATTYSLRVAAVSAAGTGAFATIAPPTVSTGPAGGVTTSAADLSGTVDANGGSATPSFEYAADAADLGTVSSESVAGTPDPVTGSDEAISATVADLTPGTEYSMRAVATTSNATVYGAVVTFTTDASIVTDDLTPTYTGEPVEVEATTYPADLVVTRTFVGIDGTVYPSSSTPPTDVGTYQMTTVSADETLEASETVTLTIEPKPIDVLVTAVDRDYDGTVDVELTLDLDGVIEGDDVAAVSASVSGEMADADAGIDKEVDIVVDGELLSGDDAVNYEPTIADTTEVTIAQLDQTVGFTTSAPDPALVGHTYVPAAESSADLTVTITVDESSDGICSIDAGMVTFDAAGECILVASQTGTINVGAATPAYQIFELTRSAQTVLLSLDDVTLADGPIALSPVIDGRPLTYVAGPAGVCSVTGASLALHGTGTCEVTATQAGTAEFLPAEATDTFVVSRIAQVVTLPVLGGVPDVGMPFPLPPTTSEGLPVTYTAGPSSVCVISGGNLVIVGSGRCTVTATQPGDGTRAPFSSTTRYDVAPDAEIGLTIEIDTSRPAAGGSVTVDGAGLLPGSFVTIELDGSPLGASKVKVGSDGTYRAVVELPDDITPGSHTISVSGTAWDDSPVTTVEHVFVDWSGSFSDTDGEADGGGYTAVDATRILDTREVPGRLVADTEYRVEVPAGLVGADATTLTVNLTVTEPSAPGFITVYPCGVDRPLASATNYTTGETRANVVDVPFTAGSDICLYSLVDTDAIIDVQGFYSPSNDSRIVPRTATRLVDTRPGNKLGAGETRVVDVVGKNKASSSATVVVLNIAATETEGPGFFTVFPCGDDLPLASNLNFMADQTVSNEVFVEPGDDGTVCIYSLTAAHVVVDLDATFEPTGSLDFESVVAGRVADTRPDGKLAAGETREYHIADGVAAAALNVVATETAGPGFLTVFPCDADLPLASNVNFHRADQTASNHVTVRVDGEGRVCVFSSIAAHIVVDVEGVFREIGG
ncbi:MAG: fibronectin type III domain-containing protein [Ilumatobacteraceae bacterium]|nr:fibronectin type III domain-containing protein [Ilumatobacteraceae bacterium]